MKTRLLPFWVLSLLAFSANSLFAQNTQYDLSYVASSPDGTVAAGQLDVVAGIAISGSLDVTAGPDKGDYILVSGIGSDSSFVYDDYIFPDGGNIVDSTAGLLWSESGTAGNSPEMNMWFNPVAEYGAPADSYSLWNNNWSLESYGAASLDAVAAGIPGGAAIHPMALPDTTPTMMLMIGALAGLFAWSARWRSDKLCPARVTRPVSFSSRGL